jgi:LPXTG-site transpeptidase (sortase) family protein
MKTKSHNQRVPRTVQWAIILAITAILFSFFLWTEVLLLRSLAQLVPETHSLQHAAADERIAGFPVIASLSIPKINVRAPVLLAERTLWDTRSWELLEERMQDALVYGTVAYPHSVLPGQQGNLIVAGHSSPPDLRAGESQFGDVFHRLPELQVSDVITLLQPDGGYADYVVRSTKVVSASETEVLKQDHRGSILTLITCYPIGTTKDRWIVTAERIDVGSSHQ